MYQVGNTYTSPDGIQTELIAVSNGQRPVTALPGSYYSTPYLLPLPIPLPLGFVAMPDNTFPGPNEWKDVNPNLRVVPNPANPNPNTWKDCVLFQSIMHREVLRPTPGRILLNIHPRAFLLFYHP